MVDRSQTYVSELSFFEYGTKRHPSFFYFILFSFLTEIRERPLAPPGSAVLPEALQLDNDDALSDLMDSDTEVGGQTADSLATPVRFL